MRRLLPVSLLAAVSSAALVLLGVAPAGAAVPLSGLVSTTPATWTPNIFAGTTTTSVCDQWFGSGGCSTATVYSTAIVDGYVVVAGAFTQACQPGPAASGHCAAGTEVTRDDIFAYQLGTGVIDPNFAPQLNQGPAYSVVAGPGNTVYVGGAFTTVNGTSEPGLVQLNVTPGTVATDGTVVTAFTGSVSGATGDYVQSMALNGSSLYIGGQFSKASGVKEQDVARLNAATGAADTTFSMPISVPAVSGLSLKVAALAVSADGTQLAIGGTFLDVAGQPRPRVALISTGAGLGTTATLANWAAPILANNCSSEHDDVRGIDISPAGTSVIVAATGYKSSPVNSASICDAVASFPTAATGTSVAPTWINYSGGDSYYSLQDTGPVVYVGGHNRWGNNECGNNNVCEPNAVLVMGMSAIDANTGLTIPWFQPETERGNGIMSLTTFPAGDYTGSNGGLLMGNNVNTNAGAYHSFNALFPLAAVAPASPTFGSIPSGIFSQGAVGGYDEGGNKGLKPGIDPMCIDDAGDSSTVGTTVDFATCDNAPEQNWTVESDGNIELNGLCLDTAGEAITTGTDVDLNTCGTSTTQVWTQGTGNTLVNSAASLCLTDPGSSTTSGTILTITACGTTSNQVWPLPAAPAPASLIPAGPLYSASLPSSGQPACIVDVGNSKKSGTATEMSSCYGGTGQTSAIESNGNIEIQGLCLDTLGEAIASGTQVVLNTCGTSTTQVWTPGTGHTLVNQGSGLCLNITSSANLTPLSIATCAPAPTQEWYLPAM
ncbi:MAG: ricin-type beta-trefoil lectin domain protein [Streptosporangiaceae bacterium]